MEKTAIHIIPLDTEMSVCKVIDYSGIDLTWNFYFVEKTDDFEAAIEALKSKGYSIESV